MISNAWTKIKKIIENPFRLYKYRESISGFDPNAGQTWYNHFYTPSISYPNTCRLAGGAAGSGPFLFHFDSCTAATAAAGGSRWYTLVNWQRSRCGGGVSRLRIPREPRKTATITFQLSGSLLLWRERRVFCVTFSVSDNVSALSFEIRERKSFRSC